MAFWTHGDCPGGHPPRRLTGAGPEPGPSVGCCWTISPAAWLPLQMSLAAAHRAGWSCVVVLCCVAGAHLCRMVLCPVHPVAVCSVLKPGMLANLINHSSGTVWGGAVRNDSTAAHRSRPDHSRPERCSCSVLAKWLPPGRSPEKHGCCWFGAVGVGFVLSLHS